MVGMQTMSGAVAPLKDNEHFVNVLTMFKNPAAGILAGILFTAVLQSASASVGILQALSMSGTITFAAALPITMVSVSAQPSSFRNYEADNHNSRCGGGLDDRCHSSSKQHSFQRCVRQLIKNQLQLLPATFFSPSPIRDIPKRNSATPLSSDKIIVNVVICTPNHVIHPNVSLSAILFTYFLHNFYI